MFSQASFILSTIGPMTTRPLLIHVTMQSVRILLECFLVLSKYGFDNTFQTLDTNNVRSWQFYSSDRVSSTGYVYPDGEAPEKQHSGVHKFHLLTSYIIGSNVFLEIPRMVFTLCCYIMTTCYNSDALDILKIHSHLKFIRQVKMGTQLIIKLFSLLKRSSNSKCECAHLVQYNVKGWLICSFRSFS